ncbi:MAG: type II CRISPR RNA-guided endonuclease Cas9 [Bacteroidetes bacterium]|nr:MAG: type II CRISPR RNA-guided endonuclease Cas9 [Bacteroidota bacterium]
MKKILGLDLGTASIGWAFLNLDGDNSELKAGVRIIPLNQEDKAAFEKGQSITLNADRRLKRGARKTLDRWQMRRENLINWMLKHNWAKSREELLLPSSGWSTFNNRSKAVTEKISLLELGQVILRLNKNRGFKSNRKTDSGEENSTDYKKQIAGRDNELVEKGLTIGQIFVQERDAWLANPEGPEPHFNSRTYSRASVVAEFEAIWSEQMKHHSEITEADRKEFRDYVLFYQRPLKSQKHLIGKCPFETSRRVAPRSSPVFQEFRLWQDLKHFRVIEKNGGSRPLTYDEQISLSTELRSVSFPNKTKILRFLGLSTAQFTVSVEKLIGNIFSSKVEKIIGDDRLEFVEVDCTLDGNEFDKQPSMQLWHLLYSSEDHDHLVNSIVKRFPEITEEEAEDLANIKLPDDHARLSHKAIRKILPFIRSEECPDYFSACASAGYNHSFSETKEEREKKVLKEKLEPILRNSLRNPVVEKVLNQVVNLVNAILEDENLGRPDEIHIELARDLKNCAKKRKSITKNNRDNEANRLKVKGELEKLGQRTTRSNILRYQLWEECDRISLYTGNPIPISKLFTYDYEIEHIIPQALIFDDGYLNKTISERSENLAKGSTTAMEYMQTKGEAAVDAYEARIRRAKGISKPKADKLRWLRGDIPDGFIERQLKETQYIAKMSYSLLKDISREVIPMAGSVTAYLRRRWGLEDMLSQINFPRYDAIGQTKEITINHKDGSQEQKIIVDDWSKRDDHRHHAMDAITVAFASYRNFQYLNTLSGRDLEIDDSGEKDAALSPPISKSLVRKLSKDAMENILISRKAGKRSSVWSKYQSKTKTGKHSGKHRIPRGQLHLETVYGSRLRHLPSPSILSKIPEDLSLIVEPAIREVIKERLESDGLTAKKAFTTGRLKKNPLLFNDRPIETVACYERIFVIRKPLDETVKIEKVLDKGLQRILQARLEEFDNNKKKAFTNLENNPVWADRSKTKALKRITIQAHTKTAKPLRRNASDDNIDFVDYQNNHHLALYLDDESGKPYSEVVSLMDAVHREQEGGTAIRKVDSRGNKLLSTLAGDEYVLFDIEAESKEEILGLSSSEISPHLFRVQNLGYSNNDKKIGVDCSFRHHLETSINHQSQLTLQRIRSINNLPSWKVRINVLGQIVHIESTGI